MTTDVIGTDELAAVLQEMEASKRTGTLFIRAQDGHMSMIAFDEGALVGISRGGHKGASALPLILEFTSGTYSIAEASLVRRQSGLPSVKEFVALLKGGVQPAISAEQPSTVSTAETSTAMEFPVERAFERIGQILITFIGPIGTILCRQAAARLGVRVSYDSAWSAVIELANDVDGIAEREQFLMQAEKILQEYSDS